MTLLHQAALKAVEARLMNLADEAIHAYAGWLADFIAGDLPSPHTDRLNAEKDAAREKLRLAIVSALQQQPEPVAEDPKQWKQSYFNLRHVMQDWHAQALAAGFDGVPDVLLIAAEAANLFSALNAMLTQFGMDEDEWSRPTFKRAKDAIEQYLAARKKDTAPPALQHQEEPPVHIDVERMNRALRGLRILIPDGLSVEGVVAFINGHADSMAEQDQQQQVPRPDHESLVEAIATHIDGWRSATFGWQGDPDPSIEARNREGAVQGHAAECLRRIHATLAASPSTTRQQEVGSGFWWCARCQCEVPSRSVTYEETHDVRAGGCGHPVGDIPAAPSTPEKAQPRLVEGPPRDFGQAQDRYGEHMDRPAPGVQALAVPASGPLRDLGAYLARVLDEDQWAHAEALLLKATDGVSASVSHPLPAQANDGGEHA